MDWKSIKFRIKNIKIIGALYQFVIGNYKIRKKQDEDKKRLQEHGVEILKQIELTLEHYNKQLFYFADYGTLLGIYRDKQLISWDMDVDYGLIVNDTFQWKDFEEHLKIYGFKKVREFYYHNKIKEQTYEYLGLRIDFFAKEDDGNNSIVYGFYIKDGYKYGNYHQRHVREVRHARVQKVKKEFFMGIYVTIPYNTEEYLESLYSDNWRIPNPNWDNDKNNDRDIRLLEDLGVGKFYD